MVSDDATLVAVAVAVAVRALSVPSVFVAAAFFFQPRYASAWSVFAKLLNVAPVKPLTCASQSDQLLYIPGRRPILTAYTLLTLLRLSLLSARALWLLSA
jgi:hypothetical protein